VKNDGLCRDWLEGVAPRSIPHRKPLLHSSPSPRKHALSLFIQFIHSSFHRLLSPHFFLPLHTTSPTLSRGLFRSPICPYSVLLPWSENTYQSAHLSWRLESLAVNWRDYCSLTIVQSCTQPLEACACVTVCIGAPSVVQTRLILTCSPLTYVGATSQNEHKPGNSIIENHLEHYPLSRHFRISSRLQARG